MDEDEALAGALSQLNLDRYDERAWASLYKSVWSWVYGYSYRYLRGARELAEDASQEVFIRLILYCPFGSLQDPISFRAYVRTVCLNVARNYLREISKWGEAESQLYINDVRREPLRYKGNGPTLDELLAQLEGFDRELLKLTADGYSLKEIMATNSELTYSNTAIRLHRMRRKLRKYLLERNEDRGRI